MHEGKTYPCAKCDYQGSDKRNLVRHQHSLHEGRKYPCDKCDTKGSPNNTSPASSFGHKISLQHMSISGNYERRLD